MVKDKALLAGSGLILAVLLFIFGRTTEPKKPVPVSVAAAPTFDIEQLIEKDKKLSFIRTELKSMVTEIRQKYPSLESDD